MTNFTEEQIRSIAEHAAVAVWNEKYDAASFALVVLAGKAAYSGKSAQASRTQAENVVADFKKAVALELVNPDPEARANAEKFHAARRLADGSTGLDAVAELVKLRREIASINAYLYETPDPFAAIDERIEKLQSRIDDLKAERAAEQGDIDRRTAERDALAEKLRALCAGYGIDTTGLDATFTR